MKLGAVLIPATNLLTPDDLRDRFDRGAVRHVIAGAADTAKFADLGGDYTRICVGAPAPGWLTFADSLQAPGAFTPDGPTPRHRPAAAVLHVGHDGEAEAGPAHATRAIRSATCRRCTGSACEPGDVHLNISSPGWAKHAWSCFFAPWNAGACVFIYNYARFNAPGAARRARALPCDDAVRAADGLAHADPGGLDGVRDRLTLRELIGAGEPLNPEVIEQVAAAWGITIRDGFGQTETTAQIGNSPGQPVKPGSMGRPLPGYRVALLDADGSDGRRRRDLRSRSIPRPLGLMAGYHGRRRQDAQRRCATATTAPAMSPRATPTATSPTSAAPTTCSRPRTTGSARSSWRASLIEHEAVAEAAVVPSPDPVRLAVPKAFVVLAPGFAPRRDWPRTSSRFMREHLAPYKRVRRLEFAELPKTISGKIRRVELRAGEIKRRDAGERGEWEFFEEDFTPAKGSATTPQRGTGGAST